MPADPFLLGEPAPGADQGLEISAPAGAGEARLLRLRLEPGARPGGAPWPAWARTAGDELWLYAAPGGRQPRGEVAAWFEEDGSRRPAVSSSGAGVTLHFDPALTAAHIMGERYVDARRPLHTYAPWLVAALPGPARLLGHRVASRVERLRHGGHKGAGAEFPAFPTEPALELVRWLMRLASGLAGRSVWPGGADAVAMITCDVDTERGQIRMPAIAQEAERLGLRACFYVVGDRFPLDHGLLDRLRAAGHEIGLHGAKHDMRLAYLGHREVMQRLDRCRELTERHEVVGFRSPALLCSPALTRALTGRFRYDSSLPDSDVDTVAAPRRGCAALFPFWQGSLLQLPLTLPLDDRLMLRGQDEAQMVRTWRRKMAWIRQVGGAAMITTHAEPHLGGSPRMLPAYRELLQGMADEAWPVLLPREVAEHFHRELPPHL